MLPIIIVSDNQEYQKNFLANFLENENIPKINIQNIISEKAFSITDVRNIGAIARSALCSGAQALIIPDKGVGALNEEALKSSAGALEQIQVCRVNSLLKAVDTLHLNGFQVFTSEMRAEKNVFELNFTLPTCIIMGAEGKGVQAHLAKAADYFFKIPMAGNFNSFNVSVATGIILYEALKQRQFS